MKVQRKPLGAGSSRERHARCFDQVVRLDLSGTADSYRRWAVEGVAADLKEAICRVSDSAFNAEENANIPTVTYEVRAYELLIARSGEAGSP